MATFTDECMELTVNTQVIENICHPFRFDAFEGDLTPNVSLASEICNRKHVLSPLRLAALSIAPDAKENCHLRLNIRRLCQATTFATYKKNQKQSCQKLAGC